MNQMMYSHKNKTIYYTVYAIKLDVYIVKLLYL